MYVRKGVDRSGGACQLTGRDSFSTWRRVVGPGNLESFYDFKKSMIFSECFELKCFE